MGLCERYRLGKRSKPGKQLVAVRTEREGDFVEPPSRGSSGLLLTMILLMPAVATREAVQALLRHDIPDVMLAGVFLACGLAALVLYRLRQRNRERAWLWFSLFAILYGVRLLIATEAMGLGCFTETARIFGRHQRRHRAFSLGRVPCCSVPPP